MPLMEIHAIVYTPASVQVNLALNQLQIISSYAKHSTKTTFNNYTHHSFCSALNKCIYSSLGTCNGNAWFSLINPSRNSFLMGVSRGYMLFHYSFLSVYPTARSQCLYIVTTYSFCRSAVNSYAAACGQCLRKWLCMRCGSIL